MIRSKTMGLSHEEPSRVDRIRHWSVSFDASARDVLKGGLTNQIEPEIGRVAIPIASSLALSVARSRGESSSKSMGNANAAWVVPEALGRPSAASRAR